MTTWADLRAGDVIQAGNGTNWRVDRWEQVQGARWLAAGGGGKHDRLFTLSPLDHSRPPITATHALSDPVARVFEYDRREQATALTALSAVFENVTVISEGEQMEAPQPRVQPHVCKHPEPEHSKLKDGRVFCAACFTTIGDTIDAIADDGLAHAAGLAFPVGAARDGALVAQTAGVTEPAPVGVYQAVDVNGVSYAIPADQRQAACDAGIHPVDEQQLDPSDGMAGCRACGLVWPTRPAESVAAPPVAVAEPVAPAVVVERPAAPVDVFADPTPHAFEEVKRDRWGRYVLPDPRTGEERAWVRVSTLARAMSDEYNLTGWKLRQVARGVALNRDLIAGVGAADADDKKTLDGLVKKAMERAESSAGANLGTAVHSYAQRLDRGESLESLRAPADIRAVLVEYLATLRRHALKVIPELMERIVICPDLGVAGTFDRIVQQSTGHWSSCPLTVLDLKTGKDLSWGWGEIAIQQACYNHATHMWDPKSKTWVPMPAADVLDRDRALVLHLPIVRPVERPEPYGDVYGVNTIEGWDAAQLGEQVRQFRNSATGLGWLTQPTDPESLLIHRISLADGPELSRLWERHHPAGEWTPAVQDAAELRVARLQAVPVG